MKYYKVKRISAIIACLTLSAIALFPTVANAASVQSVGKTNTAAIEDYVQQQAKASHIPGIAIGIVRSNKVVAETGFGDANANTPFFLASLSKSFTALAMMQLVDAGKVSLQDPVNKYIPWFKVGDGSQSKNITVLQVLDQTSGISTKAGLIGLKFKPTTTLTQAIQGFEPFPLVVTPGKTFQYSNANYMIAGYIIERASGESYETYVQQHIFAPLDMTHTYAVTGTANEKDLTRGHANWFGFKAPLTDQISPALMPDGGIISSASDMAHYLIAQMNNGVYNGKSIVSANAIKEMHAGLVPLTDQAPLPNATAYGLGWGSGTVNGTPIISHDGQLRDVQTNMAILPDKHTAVIMLINEDGLLLQESTTYDGVIQGITTGNFPAISHYFTIFYGIFDLVVLASLLLMIRSFARTNKRLQKLSKRAASKGYRYAVLELTCIDLFIAIVIAILVFYGIAAASGASTVPITPTLMMFSTPDLSVWFYVIIGFFVIRPVVRVAVLAIKRSSEHQA